MKHWFYLSVLFLITFQPYASEQVFNTASSGDIESAQTWENGMIPPFLIVGNNLEIPSNVELKINHELTTTKSEVVNKGMIHITYSDPENPTIHWQNSGNIILAD